MLGEGTISKQYRIERELAGAQAMQNSLFPAESLRLPGLRLSGSVLSASECSGDWWQYAVIDDQAVMVLGDVTGHGVPAALVTVAAHVGFTLAVSEFKENEGSFTMGGLLAKLQRSVSVTGGLEASMTFVAARINLATGEAEIFNGGNPCPMLVRGSKVFPIFGVFNRALGNFGQPPGAFSSMSLQLQQGDRILFYTDGMLERRPRDGGKISRMRLAANVAELCSREGSSAESICQGVMSQISAFMNGPLPDDITCIVAEIPLISRAMALQYP